MKKTLAWIGFFVGGLLVISCVLLYSGVSERMGKALLIYKQEEKIMEEAIKRSSLKWRNKWNLVYCVAEVETNSWNAQGKKIKYKIHYLFGIPCFIP